MRPTNQLNVGDEAPDFCLAVTEQEGDAQRKHDLCLHDHRGVSPVLLEFFMAAFTPI